MQVHANGALQLPASVLTIGALDGVHKGHQALISTARNRADQLGVPLVVYTFDPPPRVYFKNTMLLTTVPEKLERLETLRVDHVIIAPFNQHFMRREIDSFIGEIKQLCPMDIWEGPDFHFGKNREGNLETLRRYFTVHVLDSIKCNSGKVISSTRIRNLFQENKVFQAEELLGWKHVPTF